MKRISVWYLIPMLAGLSGCTTQKQQVNDAELFNENTRSTISLRCDDGSSPTLTWFPQQGVAVLRIGETATELHPQPVASGSAYSNGKITLHAKGNEALLINDGNAPISCQLPSGKSASSL